MPASERLEEGGRVGRPVGPHGLGQLPPGRAGRDVEGSEPEPGRERGGHREGHGPAGQEGQALSPAPPSTWTTATHAASAASVIAQTSAEPARTCSPIARPRTRTSRARRLSTARSAARKTAGIHAALAKWCQRSTSERNGPDSTQAAAPARAAPARQPPAPRERVERDPGQQDVAEGEERVVDPGAHDEVQPGRRVEDLRRRVGEERLPERGARVPERASAPEATARTKPSIWGCQMRWMSRL